MSTELTPIQERLRQHLIEERAKKADPSRPFAATISYMELCAAVDPDQRYFSKPRFGGIGPALRAVSLYEHAHGRPLPSALVVRHVGRRPGTGFTPVAVDTGREVRPGQEHAVWRAEVERVVRYWTGPGKDQAEADPAERALALLATIAGELEKARRLLGAA